MGCLGFIIALTIGILLSAGGMHLAAWITGHADRGFGAAIACTISLYVMYILVGFCVGIVGCFAPCVAAILGVIVIFFVTISIIQSVYGTAWGNAFVMWLITVIVSAVINLIIHGTEIFSCFGASGGGGV